jgi:hypothetical protein
MANNTTIMAVLLLVVIVASLTGTMLILNNIADTGIDDTASATSAGRLSITRAEPAESVATGTITISREGGL